MLQLLHISTQPCHIPLTIKPKVSLCCVQEGKCWDISPIYRRGEISVNITKKSLIYRLEAINRRFFSLICCHKKKSPIFLQFIGDFSVIFLQKENALLCPGSLSPTNLLLGLHSPLCLYMRPPWFHLPSAQAYQFAEAPLSQPKNIFENKLIIIIIKKYKNNHHNLFS